MDYFKGDALEIQMAAVPSTIVDQVSLQKDLFLESAYECKSLGDLIYEEERSPLANAIDQDIFRSSFKDIIEAFIEGGSFESYLTVFRKIFGDDVEVEFTVPAPGKLIIDIVAAGLELSDSLARYIDNNEYAFDEIIDDEDDNIAFRTILGFESQYELEKMLHEMVPAGIYTEISLTVG